MLGDMNSSYPNFSIILGDFNARSNNCWQCDTQTNEDSQIDYLITCYGFQQLISEPTPILNNSFSCIDFIFTDQPNLITDGTYPSLHPNCHHNITFRKVSLRTTYPPPYRKLVWNFKRANILSIRKTIKMVDWQFMFLNKSTHEQVAIFNDIVMNIFSNYIPNKYVTIGDRYPLSIEVSQ